MTFGFTTIGIAIVVTPGFAPRCGIMIVDMFSEYRSVTWHGCKMLAVFDFQAAVALPSLQFLDFRCVLFRATAVHDNETRFAFVPLSKGRKRYAIPA